MKSNASLITVLFGLYVEDLVENRLFTHPTVPKSVGKPKK